MTIIPRCPHGNVLMEICHDCKREKVGLFEMSELDSYYYSRDHEGHDSAWCVRGPDEFHLSIPDMDKNVAYIVGKVLSGKWGDAKSLLDSLVQIQSDLSAQIYDSSKHDGLARK